MGRLRNCRKKKTTVQGEKTGKVAGAECNMCEAGVSAGNCAIDNDSLKWCIVMLLYSADMRQFFALTDLL